MIKRFMKKIKGDSQVTENSSEKKDYVLEDVVKTRDINSEERTLKNSTIRDDSNNEKILEITGKEILDYKHLWDAISHKLELPEVDVCIKDVKKYARDNKIVYEERGIEIETASDRFLRLIGIVNIGINHKKIIELDYCESLSEFVESVKSLGVTGDMSGLDENGDIEEWVKELDYRWKKNKQCFHMIDMDSDSYVLFVDEIRKENLFKYYSIQIGEKICRVGEPMPIVINQEMFNIVSDQLNYQDHGYVSIGLTNTTPTIFESKLGGLPYLDEVNHVPTNHDGVKLVPLAQIVLEELPFLPIYLPEAGMIQFWIENNDMYGLEFDEDNGGHLVRYIDKVNQEITEEYVRSQYDGDIHLEDFPFDGTFGMVFSKSHQEFPIYLDMYQEHFINKWNQIYPAYPVASIDEFGDMIDKAVEESMDSGHKIGGYPFFTQYDPREITSEHKLLLLQIDSDHVDERFIYWGDSGIANFFIRQEDLDNLDFSNVIYNWDCC